MIKYVSDLIATGQLFSPGTTVSSTNKTDRHDIHVAEILLKVALNSKHTYTFNRSLVTHCGTTEHAEIYYKTQRWLAMI